MAVETNTSESTSERKPAGKSLKQRKGLIIAASGLGAVLLIAHKGNSGKSAGTDTGLNNAATNAAAEQAAIDQAVASQAAGGAVIPDTVTTGDGTFGGGSTGGDTTAPPQSPVTVNITPSPANPSGTPTHHGAGKNTGGASGHGNKDHKPPKGHDGKGQHTKEPPKGEGKKAGKEPAKHKGTHPSSGGASVAPAEAHAGGQSMNVHGREFPGATGAVVGPPNRKPGGGVSQTVKVTYGSHTDTHTSHNAGQEWTDHTPGHSPPSRGVPQPKKAAAPTEKKKAGAR